MFDILFNSATCLFSGRLMKMCKNVFDLYFIQIYKANNVETVVSKINLEATYSDT